MTKKNFDTNVATAWISSDISNSEKKTETSEKEVTEQVKHTPAAEKKESPSREKRTKAEQPFTIIGKETKSRRTSILLTESVYSKLESLSRKNGISVNSCINQILEQVLA